MAFRRNFALMVLSSCRIISSSFMIQQNGHLLHLPLSNRYNRHSRLSMTALPSIEAMRTIEIRRELESYGIQARSAWGGQELAEVLRRQRTEIAMKRQKIKKKKQQQEHEDVDETENLDSHLNSESRTNDSPNFPFIDVEPVPDVDAAKTTPMAKKRRRPIISRIGGFLSKRHHKKNREKGSQQKKAANKQSVDPSIPNTPSELPFFLEFLDNEDADTGPISVEVVRLKTERLYGEDGDDLEDADDTRGGSRKRLLYTRGFGRRKRSKKSKAGFPNTTIKPMGQLNSMPNFIDTYSRGVRRIEYQHHFQVLQDDESTTYKLQHGDPTLVNCTVIDVPAAAIHLDYRDPTLFSNLRCDDWDGFTA